MEEFMADVNKLKQKYGLFKNVEDTGFDAELQKVTMRNRNLVKGPWYKCGKGIIKIFKQLYSVTTSKQQQIFLHVIRVSN